MAIDIMQTLVELLCPTYGAQSACQNFINNPSHQVLQPLGPLIYFLFFPTVFLILLIYIGTGVVLRGNVSSVKGLRLLLSVAVLVAIIIQGYYPMMLWLSDLWFLLLPLIFVLFFIIRHFGHGGGGMPRSGGGMLGFTKRVLSKMDAERNAEAKSLEAQIKELEISPLGSHGRLEKSGSIAQQLEDFRSKTNVYGSNALSDYDRLFKLYKKACEKQNLPVAKELKR